jgi:hypothetical protein
MDQMRVDAVENRARAKLDLRQEMIDRQVEQLRALRDNQEQVLNKQVAEAEDKANRLYEEQQRRKFEMKQAIDRSRALQVDRKQQQKASELNEEKDFADFWKVRNQELQLAEQQEREEEKQRQLELVSFLKGQSKDKLTIAENKFRQDNKHSVESQALLDQQEKNFYSYAERCIRDWEAAGKNVKPLIIELKNYRKRIQ